MLSNTLSKGIIILKIAMQAGVWVARVNNSGGENTAINYKQNSTVCTKSYCNIQCIQAYIYVHCDRVQFCLCLYVQLVTVHVLDSTSVMVHQLVNVVVTMMVVIVLMIVGWTGRETQPSIVSVVTSGLELIVMVGT